MFFHRTTSPPPKTAERVTSNLDPDHVLDTLGSVLKALGKDAFDLEQIDAAAIRGNCEEWARHVLVGAPVSQGPATPDGVRNWQGVQAFVTSLRRREREFVTRSFSDLRTAMWTVLQGLNKAVSVGGEADDSVRAHLERLRSAVQGNSLETIKHEALAAVGAIGVILQERKHRQDAHLALLGEKLATAREQLDYARKEGEVDPLTRVQNRRALDEHMQQSVDLRSRKKTTCSVRRPMRPADGPHPPCESTP